MHYSNQFKRNIMIMGNSYSAEAFLSGDGPDFAALSEFHRSIYLLIRSWYSPGENITIHTSGSTGVPTEMFASKDKIFNSVMYTQNFFSLKEGDKALLCLPLPYVAGVMMVMRALVIGMDLYVVPPCGRPFAKRDWPTFDFASLTPMQVFNTLQDESEREQLESVKNLIVVGGQIDHKLEQELKGFPNKVYSTYGMAETLAHIGMRKLNGEDASQWYTPFGGVHLSTDEDGALIIDAPLVATQRLYTHDMGEICDDGRFIITGRKGNVVNSGGIKIQIEKVEKMLESSIKSAFAISSIPDPKFGEAIVLAVEGDDVNLSEIKNKLPPYYRPKYVFKLERIPRTETDKINRKKLKELLHNMMVKNVGM